jgi:signal transduction histidine kinase
MEYVYIETTEEEFTENPLFTKIMIKIYFRLKSKYQSLDLDSKIDKMQLDNSISLSADEYQSLFWQYKYLKFRNEMNQEYFDKITNLLREVTHKSILQSKKLEELNSTKDKFFSIIAHDLKGPISSMKMMLKEIVDKRDTFSEEELNFILNEFYSQTDNTLSLFVNLLDWARSQRNLVSYNYKYFNFMDSANKITNLLQTSAKDKEIIIKNEIDEELNVYADYNTINTVLRNLVSNAIKFTNPGGIIIVGNKENSDGDACIYVQDNGVGIPQGTIEKLFRLDTNVSTKGTGDESGTGLGLIMCKDFVEKNGGKIWVESQAGIGSTFYFTIPKKAR